MRGSGRLAAGLSMMAVFAVLGFGLPWFAPNDPRQWQTVPRNRLPSFAHLLGTTNLGQDTFWLLTWAIRNSLMLGISVAFLATLIGVLIGLTAGYRGGATDRVLSFVMDSFLCLPGLPVLILLASLLQGSASLPLIAVVLVLFNWPFPARQIRAVALSMREREFVHVAWFSGESGLRIITRQIFPYLRPWAVANLVNTVLVTLAVETSLAVIGFSSAQQATLGTMIYWAVKYQALLAGRWWWIGPPVVAIIVLFIGLFLVGSGLELRRAASRGRSIA
ncbi:MAG TPA: ABC transporter permease [Acetobacteraceae bacterium]|jgi:peptide/nickel transport system permease protein|nr:ABC transporter permease [Acetobacteraceae bacterium]